MLINYAKDFMLHIASQAKAGRVEFFVILRTFNALYTTARILQ